MVVVFYNASYICRSQYHNTTTKAALERTLYASQLLTTHCLAESQVSFDCSASFDCMYLSKTSLMIALIACWITVTQSDGGGNGADTLIEQLKQMQDELEGKNAAFHSQPAVPKPAKPVIPIFKLRLSPWKITGAALDVRVPKVSASKKLKYGIGDWDSRGMSVPSRDCVLGMQQACSTKTYRTKSGCLECAERFKEYLVHSKINCDRYQARAICHARTDFKGCFDFQFKHCKQALTKQQCQDCIHFFDEYGLNQEAGCFGFSKRSVTNIAQQEDFCSASCTSIFQKYCAYSVRNEDGIAACNQCIKHNEHTFGIGWERARCTAGGSQAVATLCAEAFTEFQKEKREPTNVPSPAPTLVPSVGAATAYPTPKTPTKRPTMVPLLDTCTDGSQNGHETDIDCGGTDCYPCPVSKKCTRGEDCLSTVCTQDGTCGMNCQKVFQETCASAIRDEGTGREGVCLHCVHQNVLMLGAGWHKAGCQPGMTNRLCLISEHKWFATQAPTSSPTAPTMQPTTLAPTPSPTFASCTNGIRDGYETDVDCGGSARAERANNIKALVWKQARISRHTPMPKVHGCPPCGYGKVCKVKSDCQSSVCNWKGRFYCNTPHSWRYEVDPVTGHEWPRESSDGMNPFEHHGR